MFIVPTIFMPNFIGFIIVLILAIVITGIWTPLSKLRKSNLYIREKEIYNNMMHSCYLL